MRLVLTCLIVVVFFSGCAAFAYDPDDSTTAIDCTVYKPISENWWSRCQRLEPNTHRRHRHY